MSLSTAHKRDVLERAKRISAKVIYKESTSPTLMLTINSENIEDDFQNRMAWHPGHFGFEPNLYV